MDFYLTKGNVDLSITTSELNETYENYIYIHKFNKKLKYIVMYIIEIYFIFSIYLWYFLTQVKVKAPNYVNL